jgi:hypothetical protein
MGAVTCDIQYSGASRAAVVAAAAATFCLMFATPLPVAWRVLALLWVTLVACRALRRLSQRVRVRVDEDGAVEVLEGGLQRRGRLRPGSVALPWLTVVRWRPAGGWRDHVLLVVPSAVEAQSFRTLRVLLRWGKHQGNPARVPGP